MAEIAVTPGSEDPVESSQTDTEKMDLEPALTESHHAGPGGPDPLGAAVGSIPSGLFVVTAGIGEDVAGYLGSFIQQVSINPLVLVIAMSPQRPTYQLAQRHGEFVVHVLGRNDGGLVRLFWNGLTSSELLRLPHRRTTLGTPILEGVLSFVKCRTLDEWKGGDHAVVFGAAEDGAVLNPNKPYFYRRASGRTY